MSATAPKESGGRSTRPRRQPPVRSPVAAGAWLRASVRSARGRRTRPLETLAARLCGRFDADRVVLTDSGTTALTLAIRSLAGPDRLVALPAFSCYDLVTAAVGADARAVLYDLDPLTLAPDPASFEAALRAGARAAIVAPLYGIPVDWPDLSDRAEGHGVTLIEDAAQGHGALLHGRSLGSFGPVSVLSFGRGKGWTGSGGGALLWREPGPGPGPEPEVEDEGSAAASIRAAALGLAQAWLSRPTLYWLPAALPGSGLGETRYRPPGPIRGMQSFQAALLLETERDADEEAEVRRTHGAELAASLAERPQAAVPVPPTGSTPGYLRFPVLVSGGAATLGAGDEAARLGVAPSYPLPLGQLPALRGRLVDAGAGWPGAERLARDLLTLPTHGLVSAGERQRVVELIASRRGLTAGAVP